MADYTTSSNMSLLLPVPGVDPGPQWGENLNASLSLIDQHDHSSGNGVQITPSGMNISSDLTIAGNNLTVIRTTRFDPQSAVLAGATDLNCVYCVGVDLYYNDGNGNQIQITDSGGVAGSPGSISNLTSPASAAYVSGSQTFVWQSAANTPANMDCGSVILRNITASSKGVTLNAPAALAADYSVTFPAALPASQKFATLDASGNIAASWAVDNSTLEVSSNVVRVKDLGITNAKLAALGQQVSSSCGSFTTASASYVDVTNLTVTITTIGRPVMIMMMSADGPTGTSIATSVTNIVGISIYTAGSGSIGEYLYSGMSPSIVIGATPLLLTVPSAGTHTYKIQAKVSSGSVTLTDYVLVAYEL